MFCRNCGTKMDDSALFCPNCGTEVIREKSLKKPQEYPEVNYTPQQTHAEDDYAPVQDYQADNYAPVQNYQENNYENAQTYNAPVQHMSSGISIGKYLGIAAALIAFISLFLTFASVEVLGFKQTANFHEWMVESDVGWFFWLTLVSILLVILLQLTNHPKLSLIGCAGMIFTIVIISVAMSEVRHQFGNMAKYGIGYWLFLISTILCIVSAIITKKKR